MKKISSLLLVILLLSACVLPVSADMLWEPYGNDYYMSKGYDTFTSVARTYYVPDGMTVNFYESPEGCKLIKAVEAGTRIYVGFSRELQGGTWGVGYPYGDWETEGWFRLGRLQLEYDHETFMTDFADAIQSVEGVLDAHTLTAPVPTWTYPGSGVIQTTLDCIWEQVQYNDGKLEYHSLYTDPDGGQWGYVGYFMGRCGWIYLADLYTETPPAFPQTAENTVTDTSLTEEAPAPSLAWVYILVAVVVVTTAAVIVVFKRKNQEG